ncbi:rRNA biogenesis protein RRP5 [Quillaja saponaria]|uniref:rRNA biogenesis protein RRP5 n=1 Tax=Quillaja saponaria TaxID=32244 RepID=A0AAD7VHG0_QUISA|nr:rRNA biogenesis protein RRP5 [Quillaja saponaria]
MPPYAKKFQKSKSRDGPKLDKSSKKPFKTKANSKDAVKLALQLEDDVPDFPRGGGSSLSRQERDEIYAEVDADLKADEQGSKKTNRKKMSRKTHVADDDKGSLFGDGITGKLPRHANKITLKNISPGMKLWGLVAEVNDKDLVVSLPGGLRGLVHASDAFDPVFNSEIEEAGEGNLLPSLFSVGQLVPCVVLRLDDDKKEKGRRKIWLSLRLSLLHKSFTLDIVQEGMILSAYVKSIEDHGYILHFGLPSFMGFLPKNSQAEGMAVEVHIGQLLQGVVRSVDKTRKVVYMSSDPDTLSKCVTKDLKGISIDLLIPGMMVNARVKSILENGVMLSFFTYFTGTVDLFHLQNKYPAKNWKDDYSEGKKVNARILFIDPSSRAIGLTLNPYLVQQKAPPSIVKIGEIYDDSKVIRVDRGSGLLLEVPSTPVSTPTYVNISDVAEEEIRKLEKKYREGNHVRVRILGLRYLEGLATGILKTSMSHFKTLIFCLLTISASSSLFRFFYYYLARPVLLKGQFLLTLMSSLGWLLRAKIISVDSFGAIVQIPGGVKALCPLRHMSELEIAKPGKKFKVGAELVFRVLGCKSKRITVTHKKTLVCHFPVFLFLFSLSLPPCMLVGQNSGIISSYADAADGLITHGWITRIEKHGCFVRFYNGVQGFAPSTELGLEPGGNPSSMYNVGQVIKCRVMSSIPTSRRISLSLVIKPTRVSEDDMVKLGSLISGVVDRLTSNSVIVVVNASGFSKGTIYNEHLTDHYGHAALMKSSLKPGYQFDQLLVLDIAGNNLILSAKSSLINSAQQLPSDIGHIRPNSVVHGYICNLIESGCFVRFLGRLTGFLS